MFIGRENELALLNDLADSTKFEFLILYGRRRVGKTALLKKFSENRQVLFFSAQEKNDALNLQDFSGALRKYFDEPFTLSFDGWENALAYVGSRVETKRTIIIIDEFPFIAEGNPSVKSNLQHIIDHVWKEKNMLLILCGSSISFMEKEVMGYKSPLYGRSTAQLELLPFDYFDSACFFPNYSHADQLIAYGILGGIPCYLENFDSHKDLEANLSEKILRTGSFLKEEPQVMLRMELREPAVYNSIFEAISDGASRMNEIATKIREPSQKCSKYLASLRAIKLIDKMTPAGEDESSKKTLYQIADHYFQFWYRFVFKEKSYLELAGNEAVAQEILLPENISNYMGSIFEDICCQYMKRQAKNRMLPFIPYIIGKWWGNNPIQKKQDDIDILLMNRQRTSAIFCECKFRNVLFDQKELDDLFAASQIFSNVQERYYTIFSKSGYTKEVIQFAARNDHIRLLTIEDLFDISSNH